MLSDKNLAVLEAFKTGEEPVDDEIRSLTILNGSGDVTITWSPQNDEKIKKLISEKIAQGYSFFTMRKVVVEAIQVKRKIGAKGVNSIKNLVIDDETFDKLVGGLDDRELAEVVVEGTANLAKRKGDSRSFDAVKKLSSADDVVKAKQTVAVRPLVGG